LKAAGAAEANGSGWRLPAHALEDCITLALRRRLRTAILDGLAADADPQKISGLIARLDCDAFDLLAVIDCVCLGRHSLEISVDPHRLAQAFGISISFEDLELLAFQTPFTLRRRSVETKLLLQGEAIPRDTTLLRNMAKGHAFLEMIVAGQSLKRIAEVHEMSVRRVQQTLEFAFLSPAVVQQILEGRQLAYLSTDW
jgi:site-specific DNA recombinase